jgi:hypothetical protein
VYYILIFPQPPLAAEKAQDREDSERPESAGNKSSGRKPPPINHTQHSKAKAERSKASDKATDKSKSAEVNTALPRYLSPTKKKHEVLDKDRRKRDVVFEEIQKQLDENGARKEDLVWSEKKKLTGGNTRNKNLYGKSGARRTNAGSGSSSSTTKTGHAGAAGKLKDKLKPHTGADKSSTGAHKSSTATHDKTHTSSLVLSPSSSPSHGLHFGHHHHKKEEKPRGDERFMPPSGDEGQVG